MWLLLTALAAWIVTQLIKFSAHAMHHAPDFRVLYKSGGMPSAHAATVTALTVGALVIEGWQSSIFGVSAVLAAIVIYDTLGVRRTSGEHSVLIGAISRMIGHTQPVREVLGHTSKEVAVGVALGIGVGLAFTYTFWVEQAAWMVEPPLEWERWLYAGVFMVLTAGAIGLWLITMRWRKVSVTMTVRGIAGWAMLLPGLLGLFFSLIQFQTFGAGAWRVWPLLIISAFLITHLVLAIETYPGIRQRYTHQVHALLHQRKRQRKHQRHRVRQKRRQRRS